MKFTGNYGSQLYKFESMKTQLLFFYVLFLHIFFLNNFSSTKAKNVDDYNLKTIVEDTLNMQLYNIIKSNALSQEELIQKVEGLIKQGANPNTRIRVSKTVGRRTRFRNSTRVLGNYTSAFHEAVIIGNVSIVEKMIELGANPHIAYENELYPIIIALSENNSAMVVFLLEHGVDPTKISPAYCSDPQLVRKIIIMGADPNIPTKRNVFLINEFLETGDSSMVFFLIENGVDISSINLSKCDNIELVEKLIKKGANRETIRIDRAFKDKAKLKQLLTLRGGLENHRYFSLKPVFADDEILNVFLEADLAMHVKYKPDGCSLIFSAVEYNDTLAVNKILEKGENINVKCGKENYNLLIWAIKEDKPEMLDFFLKKGLSANSKTSKYMSALHVAVDNENEIIINMLIDAGANIEYKAKNPNKTPLEYAVWRGEYISVQTLISRAANVNSINKFGESPLIKAIEQQNLLLIKLLIENSANTKLIYKGKTPLKYAQSIKVSNDIIEYLKLH